MIQRFFKKGESFKVRKHVFFKKCWNISSLVSSKPRTLRTLNNLFKKSEREREIWFLRMLCQWLVLCVHWNELFSWILAFNFYGNLDFSSLAFNSCLKAVSASSAALCNSCLPGSWPFRALLLDSCLTKEVFPPLSTKVNSGIWRKIIWIWFCFNLHPGSRVFNSK